MTSPAEVTGDDDRPGSQYSGFLEQLRARPLSSWSHGNRAAAGRAAVNDLAALGWQAERRSGAVPAVPDLGRHVLADQVYVLLTDAERAGADEVALAEVVTALAEALRIPLR